MNKLCRQLSIESPSVTGRDCVFSFDVPVPDVPAHGARIRVVCAGACYHPRRSPSLTSLTSVSSGSSLAADISVESDYPVFIPHHGLRDAALFPGYEVAGVIESFGTEVPEDRELAVGDRVILYPYDGIPNGYVEYLVVHDLKYLIKLPDNMSLSVGAMLPAGALLAMNTVFAAHEHVQALLKERGEKSVCKILVVGTGGLALWALRIASYHFSNMRDRVTTTIATLKDDGLLIAQEFQRVNVVQWNEDLYEKQLIERTMDACGGQVDVVIDFGTTSRNLHRSMQCLSKGGVVFVIKEGRTGYFGAITRAGATSRLGRHRTASAHRVSRRGSSGCRPKALSLGDPGSRNSPLLSRGLEDFSLRDFSAIADQATDSTTTTEKVRIRPGDESCLHN
ncbi:Zinc-type alcohol dehydrogenase-like protein C1773.06c [Acromyrmex echinatior]|uniref:Zinc-type alcohol dehydrogenase-like protein C1773.06c n=1 Tax=Acromyrmex echinatior TaxID=103372 RepID=F4WWT1_ACREC|nr:Zinc-type alcohol dehydrogenase-like protein C1773.06c [Acromyrmex echinatior]